MDQRSNPRLVYVFDIGRCLARFLAKGDAAQVNAYGCVNEDCYQAGLSGTILRLF